MTDTWYDDFIAWRTENSDVTDAASFKRWFGGVFATCDSDVVSLAASDDKPDFQCKHRGCVFYVMDTSTTEGVRKALVHMTDPMRHIYHIVFDRDCKLCTSKDAVFDKIRWFVLKGKPFPGSRIAFEGLRKHFGARSVAPRLKRKRVTAPTQPVKKAKPLPMPCVPSDKHIETTMTIYWDDLDAVRPDKAAVPCGKDTALPVAVYPTRTDWYEPEPLANLFSDELIFSL